MNRRSPAAGLRQRALAGLPSAAHHHRRHHAQPTGEGGLGVTGSTSRFMA
jgi:hypothetical protein